MTLIIDAQLPLRLAELLAELGHDVVHTISLADGNKTTDSAIARLADEQGRVVVSKDHASSTAISSLGCRNVWCS